MTANLTPIIMNATVQKATLLNTTLIQLPRGGTDWLTISTAVLAVATISLALFTLLLWRTTSRYATAAENQVTAMNTQVAVMGSQTNIMNMQKEIADQHLKHDSIVIIYNRLQDEMDKLVGPLDSISRMGFEYYEPLRYAESESKRIGDAFRTNFRQNDTELNAKAFWNDIRQHIYLAPKALSEAVERYLLACKMQEEELRQIHYEIRQIDPTPDRILEPAPVVAGYGSYIERIEKYRNKYGADSDLGKKASWLLETIRDEHEYSTRYNNQAVKISIKETRSKLQTAIRIRHESLLTELEENRQNLVVLTKKREMLFQE